MNKVISREYVEKNYIRKDVIKKLIDSNGFEVYTRDYGNIDVIDIDSLYELLEGTKDEQIQKQESSNWWNKIR